MKLDTRKLFYYSLIFLISALISFLIALRPENLTADYYIYSVMYYYPEKRSGELVFQLIRWFCSFFQNGFIVLLFLHAFISLFLKFISLYRFGFLNLFYFILFYFVSFFPLWEMSQIRISLAVSFYMLALICFRGWVRYVFLVISLLTHSSIIFLLFPLFLYNFFKGKFFFIFLVIVPVAFLSKYYILLTDYSVYDLSSYYGAYSFFSLKNLLLIFLIYFCAFFNKKNVSEYVKINSIVSLSIIVFSIVLGGSFPAVAIRITDIATFLMLSSFIVIPNNPLNFYLKFLIISIVVAYYGYMNFFSDSSVFNINVFYDLLSIYF